VSRIDTFSLRTQEATPTALTTPLMSHHWQNKQTNKPHHCLVNCKNQFTVEALLCYACSPANRKSPFKGVHHRTWWLNEPHSSLFPILPCLTCNPPRTPIHAASTFLLERRHLLQTPFELFLISHPLPVFEESSVTPL
jgi:hypothetical protein